MDLDSLGYKKFKLDESELKTLKSFFDSETWTPDPDSKYKSIPAWANKNLSQSNGSTEKKETYETCCEKNCPPHYKKWAFDIILKYIPEAHSVASIDRLSATVWNGAADTGWHTDNDGYDVGEEYAVLFYHVPDPLQFEDGASLALAQKHNGHRIMTDLILPTDGDVVVMKIDNDKFEHKVTPLVNINKDRFTLLIGVIPPPIEAKKKYYRNGALLTTS